MDIIVYTHLTPRIIEILPPTESVTVQELVNVIRDWEDDNLSFDNLLSAAGKEALGGGITVGITATLQNAQLMFTGRTAPLEDSGTCTSDDSSGKILKAVGGQFVTNGIYKGCTVSNSTTGSMAVVTEIISETELRCFQITGGTRTTWLNGDTYSVYPNVQCSITGGNLVAVDGAGAELSPIVQSPNVQVVRSSSSSATLQELSSIQYSSFGGGITIDVINGESGTAFPIGTQETPVNNLTDAVSIANERGFNTLFISKSMTLGSGTDIRNFNIIGSSRKRCEIVFDTGVLCDNIGIERCNITGTLDGGARINNCFVGNLNYVNGHILDSGLYGTIVLDGNKEAILVDCYTPDQDTPPIIDMGGSGQDLSMPNYSGIVTINNLSSASEEIGVGLNAGMVILEPSITAGTIIISGMGILQDNSTGTADVNTDGLMNRELITKTSWDVLHLDIINGVSGTNFPIGTLKKPVNNLADALTIMSIEKINILHIHGDLTIDGEDLTGYTLESDRSKGNNVTITSMTNTGDCYFNDLTVNGVLSGGVRFTTCVLGEISNFDGGAKNCLLTGKITLTGSGINYLTECDTYLTNPANKIEISIGNMDLNIITCRGCFKLTNKISINTVAVNLIAGMITIESSCTAGCVNIAGNAVVTDNSGIGCDVNVSALSNDLIADTIWNEPIVDHSSTPGSTAEIIEQIKKLVNLIPAGL